MQKWLLPGQIYIAGLRQGLYSQSEFLQRSENVKQWQQRVLEIQREGTPLQDESKFRNKRSSESITPESSSIVGKKKEQV